jgi:hypothetical protein
MKSLPRTDDEMARRLRGARNLVERSEGLLPQAHPPEAEHKA